MQKANTFFFGKYVEIPKEKIHPSNICFLLKGVILCSNHPEKKKQKYLTEIFLDFNFDLPYPIK